MYNSIKNTNRVFNIIDNQLFTVNATFSYSRIIDTILLLSKLVQNTDSDELWCIGEHKECNLVDFITGAYWHFVECHNGQTSKGYQALSQLGLIYSPNFETVDKTNIVYILLNSLEGDNNV